MKKIIALVLILTFCTGLLAGCGSTKKAKTDPAPSTTAPTQSVQTTQPTQITETTEAPTEPAVTGVDPMALVGQWERVSTEVEGDLVENNAATIVITGDAPEALTISYTDREFPDQSFGEKALVMDLREMYTDCGNDQWVMDVDHIGPYETQYSVTLTEDGKLLKQNYFLIDGTPMVSYEVFAKK